MRPQDTEMASGEKAYRKIKPFGKYWERLANEMAREYQRIVACSNCGYPRLDRYRCNNCHKE